MKKYTYILAYCLIFLLSNSTNASVIGQWTESNRSWNHGNFTTIHSTLTGAGHTVESDGALTAANLANDDMFVIGEATRTLTGLESTDLLSWITNGGILWLSLDTSSDETIHNDILSGLGSGMTFSGTNTGSGSPLVAGNFATDNIFNIVGQNLNLSAGKEVFLGGSGSYLADNIFAFEQIGNGYIFTAGDRFEHNFSNSTASSTNGQLILNIAAGASPANAVPVPATLALFGFGIAGMFFRRKIKTV